MEKTKTIQELAQEVLSNMETKTRDTGREFFCLKDHKIEWMVDLCRKAHDGTMPNDFVYDVIESSLYWIKDQEGADAQSIREQIFEDNLIEPEIYNSELLEWVSSNLNFGEYVTEAMRDYNAKDFWEALQYGNQRFKETIFNNVLDSLDEQLKQK